jgi:hypothetical protein
LLKKTSKILKESNRNIETLKGVLLGLKRFNTEAHDFLAPLMSRCLEAQREKDKLDEYIKIEHFLQDLKNYLLEDIQFTHRLNERIHKLISETVAYRNYLFHHHYPWLFE